jgi:hydrogenase/urease accessory protein HupE
MPSKLAVVLFTFFCNVLVANHVHSHEGRPVYIDIQQSAGGHYSLRWKIPPVLAAGAEPVILLQGENCRQTSSHMRSGLTGVKQFDCGKAGAVAPPLKQVLESGSNAEFNIDVVLQYPQSNPALSSLIKYQAISGDAISLFNGPDTLRITLPEKLSTWQLARQYLLAGIEHILSGYDHLLFVLCLMQIANGIRRILITITGFTIAHSVTLVAASLGIWNLRVDVVEVLIALSVVMLAAEIAKKYRQGMGAKPLVEGPDALQTENPTLIWRYPAAVAAGFGLLHGFGFASALGEMGLPDEMKIFALLLFNLGVELGQAVFVAAVIFLLLFLKFIYQSVARMFLVRDYSQGLSWPAEIHVLPTTFMYPVGAVSAYWFVDRIVALWV